MERFPKNKKTGGHKSFLLLGDLLSTPPKNAPLGTIGTLPTLMPEECKAFDEDGNIDVVKSYRQYYVMKKRRFNLKDFTLVKHLNGIQKVVS